MLPTDVVELSLRSFKKNRLRTFLTILGIGVGIGAIFFLVSLGYGFQKLILEQIATADSLLSLDVTPGSDAIILNEESVRELSSVESISEIFPVIVQDTQVKSGSYIADVKINILDRQVLNLEGVSVDKGSVFDEGEGDKIIVSSAVLKLLRIPEGEFSGAQVIVRVAKENDASGAGTNTKEEFVDKTYSIKGVIANDSSVFSYVPIGSVSDIHFSYFSKVKIKAINADAVNLARGAVIDKGYYVSAISDTVEQAKQIFNIVQIVLASFGITALIVSAIGMFNTMTITLLERTQEIGIMKTLGASSLDIWLMFLTESMMIGFLGGSFGIILGFTISRILNFGVNLLAQNFGGVHVELFFVPIWFALFVIIFSTSVGFITGFYPAKRAAKLNPLEALRYK